ncbi:hypothetical protein D3C76_1735050 [compost metagenome]
MLTIKKQLMMLRHSSLSVVQVLYFVAMVSLAMVMICHSIKTSMQAVMVLFAAMIIVPWVQNIQV